MLRTSLTVFRGLPATLDVIGVRFQQTVAAVQPLHPEEPEGPYVHTDIPGPKSKVLIKELDKIQHSSFIQYFVNYDKSRGNYIVDADGNVILDMMTQISSQTLGYNHPNMIEALRDPANMSVLVNRPCLGVWPSLDWADKLQNVLLSIAPKGLTNVTTMACGACSNEHAMKSSFMAYRRRQREGAPPSQEELDSCLHNQAPGSPPLTILSFEGAFHGRTMGCTNLSHSKWQHKLDFPASDWPIVYFPKCRYPLESNQDYNMKEERRSLEETRNKIEEYNARGTPVAGVIVEAIQGEGGDNQASPEFFRQLQQICKEFGAYFLIDEVQTGGGATGQWWFHESWNLPSPPDAVTFSKKMLTGGFYHTNELRPTEGNRIFNTWMGDPGKIVLLQEVVNTVRQYGLLENVKHVGQHLLKGLGELQRKYPDQLYSPRGHGLYLAVDCRDPAHRDKLLKGLMKKGVMVGGNGVKTLRVRACLIFQQHHADIFLNLFDEVLNENQ